MDDGGPGSWARGLDVYEEVKGLSRGGVEDAVVGAGDERGGGVLGGEDGEEGLDVEG